MTSSRISQWVATSVLIIIGVFLMAPLVVVVVFAFHSSPRLALPFEGTSFRWFRLVLDDPQFSRALVTSVKVAVGVGVLSAVLGFVGASALLSPTRFVRYVAVGASSPSLFPPLLVALGFAILLHAIGAPQGVAATVLGQTLIALPFAALVILARLRSLDPAYLLASRDLGASAYTTFFRVTFPLVRSSVIAGACLAMAMSLDEFVIAFFAGGGSPTVPVVLWGLLRRGVDPTANAMATLILGLCTALVAVALVQLGRDVEEL